MFTSKEITSIIQQLKQQKDLLNTLYIEDPSFFYNKYIQAETQCISNLSQDLKTKDLNVSTYIFFPQLKEIFRYYKVLQNYKDFIKKSNESIEKRRDSIDKIIEILQDNLYEERGIRLVIDGIFQSFKKNELDSAMARANLILKDGFVERIHNIVNVLNDPTNFEIVFDPQEASKDLTFCQLLKTSFPDFFKDETINTLINQLKERKRILQSFYIQDKNLSYYYSDTIKKSILCLSEKIADDINKNTLVNHTSDLEFIFKYFDIYKKLPLISKKVNDSIDEKIRLIDRILSSLVIRFGPEYILYYQSSKQEIDFAIQRANFVLKDSWMNDIIKDISIIKKPETKNTYSVFNQNDVANTDFVKLFSPMCPEISTLCNNAKELLVSIKQIKDTDRLISLIKDDVATIQESENTAYALKEMKRTSLDALKKAKKGFHVTALQKNGINNLYQILKMDELELQMIDGIGDVMAKSLKQFVSQFYNLLLTNSPIKLQIDKNTPAYSKLIQDIYELYRRSVFLKKYEDEHLKIVQTINYLHRINNYSLCVCTNRQFKNVCEKVNYLKEKDLSPYILSTQQEAQEAFEKQPILFVGTLEKLCPNIFGKDNSKDVFTTELLKKIEGFELNLKGFRCELRSYQFFCAKYMIYRKKVLIGDEMGLGKTIEALAALVHLWNNNKKRFILFCPLTITENWQREIKKFTNIPSFVYKTNRNMNYRQYISNGGIMIVPYGRDVDIHFKDMQFDACVVDEAHWIKNPVAQRTERTLSVLNRSKYKFLMTGTPIENKVSEMIWLISILNLKLASELEQKADISQSKAFRKIASPVYFRRTTEQVALELPDLVESEEWIDLNSDERYLYEIHVINREHMAARQMSFENIKKNKSSKLQKIEDIIQNAENENRKVIIFSFFKRTLEQLKTKFGDKAIGPINGDTPVKKRQTIIDNFNNGKESILLAQILTGGTGLNIQTASVVIFCEPQYKPSIENQAVKRAHRIGQTRNVLVFHIFAKNTIEERIQEILNNKRELFKEFADSSESGLESIAIDKKLQAELEEKEYENVINNKDNARKAIEELKKIEADDNRVSDTNPTRESKDIERKKMTDKLRWCILLRDNCTCQVCGASTKTDKSVKLHVDHIIPVSKGGRTVPANLQTLCDKCNLGKMTDTYDANSQTNQ